MRLAMVSSPRLSRGPYRPSIIVRSWVARSWVGRSVAGRSVVSPSLVRRRSLVVRPFWSFGQSISRPVKSFAKGVSRGWLERRSRRIAPPSEP